MSKDTVIAVGGGGLSAAVSLSFLTGSPGAMLLAYLAPLPLLMVGLALGTKTGAIAGISGFLLAGLVGRDVSVAGLYGLLNAVPALLVVHQALLRRTDPASGATEWYPAGLVLSWLAVFGTAFLIVAAIVAYGAGDGLQPLVSNYLHQVFAIMLPTLGDAQRAQAVRVLAPLFPGAVAMIWVVVIAANAGLAQSILVRMGRNLRAPERFADLTLPDWISTLLVGAAALALFGPGDIEYMGRNAALVLAVPFFFLGLAVVHTLAGRAPAPGFLLVAFYFILLFSGWATLVVAGIGLVEQWVGLRHRFGGSTAGPGV